jgi:hypothetical protein
MTKVTTRNETDPRIPASKVDPPPIILYHWSPSSRRASINRRGFVPGSLSLCGLWRPPFTCFSDTPELAWILSGRIHPEVPDWDLWCVDKQDLEHVEIILDTYYDTHRHYIKEYRVYHRIYKRYIWWVGSRQT